MPTYDTATAAFAVGMPKKWVDNLASHHELPGVESARRGVRRQFSLDSIVLLTVIRALADEMAIPVWRAVELGTQLCAGDVDKVELPSGLQITLDLQAVGYDVRQRLLEAAESVPRIRRGRPPERDRERSPGVS